MLEVIPSIILVGESITIMANLLQFVTGCMGLIVIHKISLDMAIN